MYVVAQIYPWFYSLSYMTTDTQQKRKIEFKPRIKLNQDMNTQEGKHFISIFESNVQSSNCQIILNFDYTTQQ